MTRLLLLATLLFVAAASALGMPQEPVEPPPVLHVILLAGQSNMEGQAVVDLDHEEHYNGGRGTLARLLESPDGARRWSHLQTADGSWSTRRDVGVWYRTPHEEKVGPLSVGYGVYPGRHHFGPELEIGRALGEHFEGPVLLVKACWGGKSLHVDFRPPSAGGERGAFFDKMFVELEAALDGVGEAFPDWKDHAPHVEGFVWFQGWNDGCDDASTAAYGSNLAHLIGDVRTRLGRPDLPVVVGETGNMDRPELHAAQRAGCEGVTPRASFVPTRAFLRAARDSPNTGHGHHWFGHAESYLRIGASLGEALVALLQRD